jgi:hypothetical protein
VTLGELAQLDRTIAHWRRGPARELIQEIAIGGCLGRRQAIEHLDRVGGGRLG